jgi:hypothetical protein
VSELGISTNFVIGCEDSGHVPDLVPRRFELGIVVVHEVGVLDA